MYWTDKHAAHSLFEALGFAYLPVKPALGTNFTSVGLNNMSYDFTNDPEPLVATIARLYAVEGKAREVAILANAEVKIEITDYDNWDGGTNIYTLYLSIPYWLYAQIAEDIKSIEQDILEKAVPIIRTTPSNSWLHTIFIAPIASAEADWQDKAKAWSAGKNVTNQGRVRSNNIASRTCDGLLFRSQPEIYLYKALKSLGISFAPLPVFIRGGKEYRRIEPDFVLIQDGIVMVVEVDGDTVHHETPAEAHARTTMLVHEGVHVERVKASECATLEKAKTCAHNLLQVIHKLKANK